MKKLVSFFVILFILTGTAYADGEIVSYITDNLILLEDETEQFEPTDELYKHNLIITDNSGTELLGINFYNFINMTELFDENVMSIRCKKDGGFILNFYEDGLLKTRIPGDSLIADRGRLIVVEDKLINLSGSDNGEYITVGMAISAASENPIDYISARFNISENRLYVKGQALPFKGTTATLIVTKKDSPLKMSHIEQAVIDYNGDFWTDFKFTYNIEDYILNVIIDENSYEIDILTDTETIQSESDLNVIYENNILKVSLNANNAFVGNNKTSQIILAFYDAEDVLISCKIGNNFDAVLNETEMPKNTAKARAFAFDVINGIKPQTQAAQIIF